MMKVMQVIRRVFPFGVPANCSMESSVHVERRQFCVNLVLAKCMINQVGQHTPRIICRKFVRSRSLASVSFIDIRHQILENGFVFFEYPSQLGEKQLLKRRTIIKMCKLALIEFGGNVVESRYR